jgi:fused signal recognition particle receptor
MGWFNNLKTGLQKSSNKLKGGISAIFTKTRLDSSVLEEFEDLLVSADLGVSLAQSIVQDLASAKFDKDVGSDEIVIFLRDFLVKKFALFANYSENIIQDSPKVVMMCGVNGNGKTTTIGKIAYSKRQEGLSVMIAACDTFRAAAVDQIAVWADRAGAKLVFGSENSDPASVAHKAVCEAIENKSDLLMIDTAGRLHNKSNLMDELRKITSVIAKILPGAPHESILVIDATTGQNALSQVEKFSSIIPLHGIIVTKLDGTAKAGIVLAIMEKYQIPIIAVGVGEKIEDLKPFDLQDFVNNLL